jgi:small GTP-binding protein
LNGKPSISQTVTLALPNYLSNYKLTDGSLVNVRIIDTAGMETFRAINTSYYRQANCCLLVYDITDKRTFDDCKKYYKGNIEEYCPKNIPIVLLGNKSDMENERKVPAIDASEFAAENNYIYLETSCLKNKNVANAFETLIEIANREEKRKGEDDCRQSITITKNDIKKKKKKCYF